MHTGIFPEGYRDQFFVGNVITNQVHRDVAVWRGSSPWIETPEPFLSCRDGWFRPVDLALGPEGALYIADFYNCIIGHYEVDLHHPRRDRERGRLWRVLPRESATRVPPDLTQEPTDRLWEELSADNLTLRRLAMQEWERRHQDAPQLVVQTQSALRQGDGAAGRRVELLWMLARRERLPEDITAGLLTDRSALVRVHTVRALGAMSTWTDQQRQQVLASLHDADPWVRRAAVEALGRHPQLVQLEPLLKSWQQTAIEDSQLRHAIKIALKEHLHQPEGCLAVLQRPGKIEDQRLLVEIARAVPTESAAEISLAAVRRQIIPPQEAEPALLHIARHGSPRLWDSLAEWVADLPGELRSLEVRLFQAVWRGLQERGETPAADSAIGRWGRKLATALLNDQRPSAWFEVPTTVSAEPVWGLRQRTCADGTTAWFFDSLAYAEQRVGMLRSQPFILPEQLVFWLCGHNGLPQQPSQGLNLVRLRLLDHDQVVWQAEPPRNDVAQRYVWNVQRWAGQRAVLELIDADSGGAYAWLAIGRCEPPLISPQPGMLARDEEQQFAVRLAAEWRMEELRDLVVRLAEDPWRDSWLRGEAAETLLRWRHPVAVGLLSHLVQDPQESPALRVRAAQLLGGHSSQEGRLAVATALGTGTSLLQHPFALALARSAPGAELLLAMVANGRASSRLLLDPQVQAALRQHPINHLEDRIAQLTAGLPTLNQQVEQQWRRLSQQFTLQEASAEAGAAVFRRVCANCHRLRGEGGKVGPQLDGVGNRGLERLLEDILDPNRNVDAAFRAVVVTTKQGQVYSGLKVREEGAVLVLADSQGKEVRIPTAEIDEWQQTLLSPMPSNLLDLLQENELRDLLAFLLRQRQAITGP
ncbi:MAG: hypothetical protein KatS3mg114_0568 [Planctomycetaceae bacterium]|nr:MAG: hypothetical protein KatS3mg114_0568 [Planctomycetaceae bacterium]